MKESPILFSAPMVRAILAAQKTQTRRVVKWRNVAPGLNLSFSGLRAVETPDGWVLESDTRTSSEWRCDPTPCKYGRAGDRMWGRETWNQFDGWAGYRYAADYDAWGIGPDDDPDHVPDHAVRWKPSIHMPRAAARLLLDLLQVRVERLQSISREDALAEGIVQLKDGGYGLPAGEHYHSADPRQSYFSLWEAINGPNSVEANPWVWVLEFPKWKAANAHQA